MTHTSTHDGTVQSTRTRAEAFTVHNLLQAHLSTVTTIRTTVDMEPTVGTAITTVIMGTNMVTQINLVTQIITVETARN